MAVPIHIVERFSESELAIFRRHAVGLWSVSHSEASVVLESRPTEFLRREFYEQVKKTLRDVSLLTQTRGDGQVAWCICSVTKSQNLSLVS